MAGYELSPLVYELRTERPCGSKPGEGVPKKDPKQDPGDPPEQPTEVVEPPSPRTPRA